MNKELKDLNIDDLLNLAKKNEQEALQYKAMNEAEKFIHYNNIVVGDNKVMAIIIYDTYVEWKGGRSNALPKHMFFRQFSKIFESRRGWAGRYYMLDSSPFNNTREAFLKARKKYAHKKRKKTRRNVQKNQE